MERPPICKLCNKPFWNDKTSTDATVCVCSNTVNKESYKANLIKELEKKKDNDKDVLESSLYDYAIDDLIELIKQT